MKKIAAVGLALFLVVALCGCGNDIKLDNRKNDMIAEYIAGVMLKYSRENISDYQQLKNEQAQKETGSSQNNNGISESSQSNGQNSGQGNGQNNGQSNGGQSNNQSGSHEEIKAPVEDVMGTLAGDLGLQGMTVSYSSYYMGDSYSSDGLFSVHANSGCKVFAFEFVIKNETDLEAVANTASSSVRFKLDIGGKKIVQSSSLLLNDMINLKNVKIAAKDSYKAVVIFQVPSESAKDVSGMSVYVYSSGKEIGKVPGV